MDRNLGSHSSCRQSPSRALLRFISFSKDVRLASSLQLCLSLSRTVLIQTPSSLSSCSSTPTQHHPPSRTSSR
ncbi:hypothetical protein G7K_2012-t1 [Saitoella complicata NRRL Y-17804]|uniref:Uncharacterized protein n=1 Tax=Saitoella complicata (strain BCRC 22490 / CBS 7301 / JCM 7358 / NBRC 10748 / NRRL Y-17804) TaxID=698492 RepID=A0A0E9ND94_SAICN|nr:hypothetical protein G7K_2012-t1 [Saitoella complicata NRRL Y-17804]